MLPTTRPPDQRRLDYHELAPAWSRRRSDPDSVLVTNGSVWRLGDGRRRLFRHDPTDPQVWLDCQILTSSALEDRWDMRLRLFPEARPAVRATSSYPGAPGAGCRLDADGDAADLHVRRTATGICTVPESPPVSPGVPCLTSTVIHDAGYNTNRSPEALPAPYLRVPGKRTARGHALAQRVPVMRESAACNWSRWSSSGQRRHLPMNIHQPHCGAV